MPEFKQGIDETVPLPFDEPAESDVPPAVSEDETDVPLPVSEDVPVEGDAPPPASETK